MTDQEYMLRAIQLAQKGEGWTNPNPMEMCIRDSSNIEDQVLSMYAKGMTTRDLSLIHIYKKRTFYMIRSMPEDFGKKVRHASCIRISIYQESESNEGNT